VSLYHQGDNLDRDRIRRLTGAVPPPPRPPAAEWLRRWIAADPDPREQLDSLPGVLWHLSDAWSRRDAPNVVLVHYDDLLADLGGEMGRLAGRLGIDVPAGRWPALVGAATFDAMRARADDTAPDARGVLVDRTRFFRRGTSGAGAELLAAEDLDRYRDRVADLVPPDLAGWLHHRRSA
jgi:aryl sulfotransferase